LRRNASRADARYNVYNIKNMKKIISWSLGSGLAVVAIGGFIWYAATRPPVQESDIISRNGFHWHPELVIYVNGEKQEIPKNVGLGAVHKPMHTHEDPPLIHLEFTGLVRKQDITLGQFFKIWGRDMRSFGGDMKMTVNGEENTEYENYAMRDRDKIELRFD